MTQNVYIASVYSFIPLKNVKKEYRKDGYKPIDTPRYELYAKAKCKYKHLEYQDFYYQYKYKDKQYTRKVKMQVCLLHYKEEGEDSLGQYYLVVGTGINKVFGDNNNQSYQQENFCTQQDITFLKKAFYCKDKEGFFYPLEDPQKYMMYDWLNEKIQKVSGVNPKNHFERSFIIDVLGVCIDTNVNDMSALNDRFENMFFDNNNLIEPQKQITCCDHWAYGLIFGNDNYERVPKYQVEKVIRKPFSNNFTDTTYASWNSIVFIRTHNPYPTANKYEGKPFSTELTDVSNVYEICATMNMKRKLKKIKKMLNESNASAIKEALGNITSDIIRRPFGVKELTEKTNYIYEAMGINDDLESLMRIGQLKSEAINIKNTQMLNYIVAALTAATLVLGLLQFFI